MPINRHRPLCAFCKHFDHEHWYKYLEDGRCQAFPEGIPDEIPDERYDHREPYPQDNGIQFVLAEDLNELRQRGRYLPKYQSLKEVKAALDDTFGVLDRQRESGYTYRR